MALAVEHLTRTYAGAGAGLFTAVDDFSFEAGGGEIIGLIGRTVRGTTTLRTLTGILRPTSGRVAIDNRDIVPIRCRQASAGIHARQAAVQY